MAAIEASQHARAQLGGEAVDAVAVFCSGEHLAAPEALLEGVHEALAPPVLIGCGAAGVLGDGREVERGTAVAVWAASLDGGSAEPFHARVVDTDEGAIAGLPDLEGATAAILLPDPYSFPTAALLEHLPGAAPGVPIIGGLTSARTPEGEGALFLGERLCEEGAVGVRLDGVEVLPCVSQGATPVGPEPLHAADGHVISGLAGRPALERLRDAIEHDDQHKVAGGLLLGIVIDEGKPEYEQAIAGELRVRRPAARAWRRCAPRPRRRRSPRA